VSDVPWSSGPTPEEALSDGSSFPIEWVAPVFCKEGDALQFRGTATLLGGNAFISAKHVFADPARARDFVLLSHDILRGQTRQLAVERLEPFPDDRVDLIVGEVADFRLYQVYEFIAHVGYQADLQCIGFPTDLVQVETQPIVQARYLRGHLTGFLDPGAFGADAPSLEMSFPIPAGMSGSPIYIQPVPDAPERRLLAGIALRSHSSHVALHESILQRSSEPAERIYRVVEYGIALRLSSFGDWRISFRDITLNQLIASVAG